MIDLCIEQITIMQTEKLIQSLINQSNQITRTVETLKELDIQKLTWKRNAETWNVLECLEHLNRYSEFYLPRIQFGIQHAVPGQAVKIKSGLLGGYFVKSMIPKEKLNKMKTMKPMNPLNSSLSLQVVEKFLENQKTKMELLEKSKNYNLNGVKIVTSLSKFIKMNLGDTFQFLVNHELRHLKQIERILQR